jgi:hypothetical protein
MSRAVDAMLVELAERDAWSEVMTVVLADTAGLDFALRGRTWRAYPCETMLAVTTIVPGWARGRAAAIEPGMRRIDPDPVSWSDWLLVNFSTVWNSVWLLKATGWR